MSDSWDIPIQRPSGSPIAFLRYTGEIRFGPAYYTLSLPGFNAEERIFGHSHLYDHPQALLALQEWPEPDFLTLKTRLVLLDLSRKMECRIADCSDGFISPISIDSTRLVFSRTRYGLHASISEAEIAYRNLDRWHPFSRPLTGPYLS